MNSEYGILQEKIDKIGGFRTTIRGWSVTLVIASIIAAGSTKQVSPFFLGLLFVFIYAFYAMERKQNQFASVFGARVLHLEKRMREEVKAYRQGSPVLGFYPGIAHYLHSSRKRKSSGYIATWFTDPDLFFYVAQAVAVLVAMVILLLFGPASRTPDVQNIIQTESAGSRAQVKGLEVASSNTARSETKNTQEQNSVKRNEKKER
jgi:Sec-independent protein translocase protein TatA